VLFRILACAALTALPCIASGQSAGPTFSHAKRVADVIRRIGEDYVDVLEQGPLVERCNEGAAAWLAKSNQRLDPVSAGPLLQVRLEKMFLDVAQRYPDADLAKLADACIHRVFEGLDKHSSYLDRDSFKAMFSASTSSMAGIGLELQTEGDEVHIVSSIEGTPAARSDLARGDVIVSVNGAPARGLSLTQVVTLMRGAPGSDMVLEIRRPGISVGLLRREFKREIIRVETVRGGLLEGRLLYVRITQFQENTRERFMQRVTEEAARLPEGLAGVILDLRNNPGGLLDSCVGVAAAFLPANALIVELRGRNEDNNRKLLARRDDIQRFGSSRWPVQLPEPLRSVRLAVLVNAKSAACSEIVAAAMQDYERAKVIGATTFGIGRVQTIVPMGDSSALRISTARYFRPGGAPMENSPVLPDVQLAPGDDASVFGGANDPALPAARKLLLGG
jgi:carboxyl-terminal processing protease